MALKLDIKYYIIHLHKISW